jgi:hypothetical protein
MDAESRGEEAGGEERALGIQGISPGAESCDEHSTAGCRNPQRRVHRDRPRAGYRWNGAPPV